MRTRTAVVTGGSMGIGYGVARRLLADGYQVAIVARTESRLKAAADSLGGGVLPLAADIADRTAVEGLAERVRAEFGTVDVLVNNAGLYEPVHLDTPLAAAEAAFDLVVGAGVKGAFLMTLAFADLLTAPGGRVVNMGSIVGKDGGSIPGYSAYAVAKAGIHGLTVSFARDFAPRRITVNTVAPGFIIGTGETDAFDDDRVARAIAGIPLGRAGTVEDVAGAVAYLASDEASYATGTTLALTGGWRMH